MKSRESEGGAGRVKEGHGVTEGWGLAIKQRPLRSAS